MLGWSDWGSGGSCCCCCCETACMFWVWWGEGRTSFWIICWRVAWYICCWESWATAWCAGKADTPGGATASNGTGAADIFGTIVWQGKTKEATEVWGRLTACMGRAGEFDVSGRAGFMGKLGKITAGGKYWEGAGIGGAFAAGISDKFGGWLSSPARGVTAGMTGNWGIWKKI